MLAFADRVRTALTGRYRIEQEIGSGGMSVVFRAHDLKLGHLVAVKVLRPELAALIGSSRFLREIQIASSLTHPHVITIFDSGEVDGFLYCVMPFVEGESLRTRLSRETRLGVAEAARITAETADALEFAHGKGVIHRDIKPENILLTAGHAMVGDFGIARALHAAGGSILTETGVVLGTPAYMSPEQLAGASLDERTDVFSLGCVAFEMIAGHQAFDSYRRDRVPSLHAVRSDVPEAIDRAVQKGLALDRENRYPSAGGFAEALGAAVTRPVIPKRRVAARRFAGMAALAVAVGVVGSFLWPRPPKVAALAVLPLANVSGDPSQDYFAEALTGELIRELSARGQWRVISRTSVLRYRSRPEPPSRIARELNVDAILEGTVQRIGNRVRIGAQLVNGKTETGIWSKSYTRDLEDIVDLECDVANAISDEIGPNGAKPASGPSNARRVDPKAYDAYLRGRYSWDERTANGIQAAIRYFELSVTLDSTYAPAYAGLADSYSMLWLHGLLSPQQSFARARAAAEKAISLDDREAQAHASLADMYSDYFWDWNNARKEFLRAIELDPNYATAHQWYSEFLSKMGDLPTATKEIERARELDPLSPAIQGQLATTDYFARRYDRAIEGFHQAVTTDPDFWLTRLYYGLTLAAVERYPEAVQELQAASARSPNNSLPLAALGYVYARSGEKALARAMLAQLQASPIPVPETHLALIQVGLGENAHAIAGLEKAAAKHDVLISYLNVQPVLDPLRSDARFQALLKRLGLSTPPPEG